MVTNAQRLEELLRLAKDKFKSNDPLACRAAAKQVLQIDPNNQEVIQLLQHLETSDPVRSIKETCEIFTTEWQVTDGNVLLQQITHNGSSLDDEDAATCVNLLSSRVAPQSIANLVDDCNQALVRSSAAARECLVSRLRDDTANQLEIQWRIGPASRKCIVEIISDQDVWKEKDEIDMIATAACDLFSRRLSEPDVEQQVFAIRALTKIVESYPDHTGWNMQYKALTLFLDKLDIGSPPSIRGAALVATKQVLDVTGEHGQQKLTSHITEKVKGGAELDLISAFSIAAAIFPLYPDSASELFLSEGFLGSLVTKLASGQKSGDLTIAALSLISAACQDKKCREAVAKSCTPWLQDVTDEPGSSDFTALALLILAKTFRSGVKEALSNANGGSVALAEKIINRILQDMASGTDKYLFEALSYLGLDPETKECISKNTLLSARFGEVLGNSESDWSELYAILTVLGNITISKSIQDEEQKRVAQLKAYAEASKLADTEQLDGDAHVRIRCERVIEANIIPHIWCNSKPAYDAIVLLVVELLFNLSKSPKTRGQLVQQGCVKGLLRIHSTSRSNAIIPTKASHALARILISVNPNHIFSPKDLATDAVVTLSTLLPLKRDVEAPDLLATFEALLALTNLASSDDQTTKDAILKFIPTILDDLLLHSNKNIQRATVEMICNLMPLYSAARLFVDGTLLARKRLHILLALTNAEDLGTRSAAGGALAMLTGWEEATPEILNSKSSIGRILELCEDESVACAHRGLATIDNILRTQDNIVNDKVVQAVKTEGGVKIMVQIISSAKEEQIKIIATEILTTLQ